MVYTVLWDERKQATGGQLVKGIVLRSPAGTEFTVIRNQRVGIGKYRVFLRSAEGEECSVHNTDINVKKHQKAEPWILVGRWHTPQELADMYGKKLDPDANKPRHMRKSFWAMESKPGTINYKQKQRLLAEGFDPSKL